MACEQKKMVLAVVLTASKTGVIAVGRYYEVLCVRCEEKATRNLDESRRAILQPSREDPGNTFVRQTSLYYSADVLSLI